MNRGWEKDSEYQTLSTAFDYESKRHEKLIHVRQEELREFTKHNTSGEFPPWYMKSWAKVRQARAEMDSYARNWCEKNNINPTPFLGKKIAYEV